MFNKFDINNTIKHKGNSIAGQLLVSSAVFNPLVSILVYKSAVSTLVSLKSIEERLLIVEHETKNWKTFAYCGNETKEKHLCFRFMKADCVCGHHIFDRTIIIYRLKSKVPVRLHFFLYVCFISWLSSWYYLSLCMNDFI